MEGTISMSPTMELTGKLDRLFAEIQQEKNVLIPVSVRLICENLILESFEMRKDEWQRTLQLDVDAIRGKLDAIEHSVETLEKILGNIEQFETSEGEVHEYLTITSFLDILFKDWCKIFPFC